MDIIIVYPDSKGTALNNRSSGFTQEFSDITNSYLYYYPYEVEIELEKITCTLSHDSIIFAEIKLNSKENSSTRYSFDNSLWTDGPNNLLHVPLGPLSSKKPISKLIKVQSKKSKKNFEIQLSLYTSSFYLSNGLSSPSYLIVHRTNIPHFNSHVEDWIVVQTTTSEKQFAWETWGKGLGNIESPYEKAKLLAIKIIDQLQPYLGTPSDSMTTLEPFQQFTRACSGKDKVWCGNISNIFIKAAISLGIPTRYIQLGNYVGEENNVRLLLSEGHAISEIFDAKLNKWILMDLTGNILGARLNSIPLSAFEFFLFLNNSVFQSDLTIDEFISNKKVKNFNLKRAPSYPFINNYYKINQKFLYLSK